MKKRARCALAVLVGVLVTSSSEVSPVARHAALESIGYQVHSANDLGTVVPLVRKGARAFKLDPHFVASTAHCRLARPEESWEEGAGCLLLSHDTPGTQPYNTTDELLGLLSSPALEEALRGGAVTVALCFKSGAPCEDSRRGEQWQALVDDLFREATARAPSFVSFILDGDAKPFGCNAQRWRPWPSVWISGDLSPEEAFWSSDPREGFDRYQVLNQKEDMDEWTWMQSVNYGKFSNLSQPLQLWEPDAQDTLLSYADLYSSGPPHLDGGFHFAINTDPRMFEVYTAGRTHHAWNTPFEGTASWSWPALLANPAGDLAAVAVSNGGGLHLMRGFQGPCAPHDFPCIRLAPAPVPLPEASQVLLRMPNRDAAVPPRVSLVRLQDSLSCPRAAMITGPTGAFVSYCNLTGKSADNAFPAPIPEDSGVLPLAPGLADRMVSLAVSSHGHGASDATLVAELLTTTALDCPLAVQVLGDHGAVAACVTVPGADGPLTSGSIAITGTTARSDGPGLEVGLLAAVSDGQSVFATSLDLAVQHEEKPDMQAPPRQVSAKARVVGAGTSPSLSVLHDTVALVWGGGYCYNSHAHNTRARPKVCSASPSRSNWTLEYTVGRTADLVAHLRGDQNASSSQLLTPCTTALGHGAWALGANPSAALFPLSRGSGERTSLDQGLAILREGF
eukprot:CAMPEP_0118982248 /NCGR_PEP_ID=MMETSP1173-20130426/32341_1 /TAXON_ID=1034831 /ORGANISM="Rhizochromulina marina cf, Strain CCMP1243" /LENGTH=677 /DNA_ID=CAMNT_0006932721 /DNA_START=38 /DNA_END=2068 /DNA_ORIENTATION=-